MCGTIVTSVEVSDEYAHAYPYFKGLVDRTADAGFKMKEEHAADFSMDTPDLSWPRDLRCSD